MFPECLGSAENGTLFPQAPETSLATSTQGSQDHPQRGAQQTSCHKFLSLSPTGFSPINCLAIVPLLLRPITAPAALEHFKQLPSTLVTYFPATVSPRSLTAGDPDYLSPRLLNEPASQPASHQARQELEWEKYNYTSTTCCVVVLLCCCCGGPLVAPW